MSLKRNFMIFMAIIINTCFMLSLMSLFISSAKITSVYAQKYVNPEKKLHSYKLLFTNLQPGTIPTTLTEIDTFYINSQVMSLTWNISGELKEYNEQAEPIAFAQVIDSVVVEFLNSDVTYFDSTTAQILQRPETLTVGEWQVQIAASIQYGDMIKWSKYSNAVPFYTELKELPFNAPGIINIKFGYNEIKKIWNFIDS